jgi:hypothetical protein
MLTPHTHWQFQRLFAINLPSRTDRRDALASSATVSNLSIDFIDGVYGDDVVLANLSPEQNRKINNNVKGSWKAHINVLTKSVLPSLSAT